jgi:hypothetical protein
MVSVEQRKGSLDPSKQSLLLCLYCLFLFSFPSVESCLSGGHWGPALWMSLPCFRVLSCPVLSWSEKLRADVVGLVNSIRHVALHC